MTPTVMSAISCVACAERSRGVPGAVAQRLRDREHVARQHQYRHGAVLGDRLCVGPGGVRNHDAAGAGFGERHEVGAGTVDRHGAQPRRRDEQIVGQLAAGDDALSVPRHAQDRAGVAVRRAYDDRAAR
jgi:hypothetical protein